MVGKGELKDGGKYQRRHQRLACLASLGLGNGQVSLLDLLVPLCEILGSVQNKNVLGLPLSFNRILSAGGIGGTSLVSAVKREVALLGMSNLLLV